MSQISKDCRNLGRGSAFIAFFTIVVSVLFIPQYSYSASLTRRQFGAGVRTDATGAQYVEEVPGTEGMSEMEVITTLRHDIQLLDEELAKCEKKRKGWVAATVVGGVGVLGTGIAAIAQGSKIKEQKTELQNVKGQIDETNRQINTATQKLNN